MKTRDRFITYVPRFHYGDDALLLLADNDTIGWLMSQFARLSNSPVGSRCAPFIVGDGNPVESDGRCVLTVELNDKSVNSSRLDRTSENAFGWSVSRSSANRYQNLLSGMLEHQEPCDRHLRDLRSAAGSEGGGHQYLDPDNSPPVVIVSRDEYEAARFRQPKA